jgi:autoinducer 2 (AI-2) kinase
MTYVMGLDAGGSGGRCLLWEVGSGRVFSASAGWSHPVAPGTAGLGFNLDLDDVWAKLGRAVREVLSRSGATPEDVLAISATSMRHTTVVLDAAGDVLLAAPNHDARALGEGLILGAEHGGRVHGIGGHWPSPIFTGARLLWMKAAAPEAFGRAARVLTLSDWLAYRLSGVVAAERSQAGETLLFDQVRREWAEDLIHDLGLPAEVFPALVDAGTRLGGLTAAAALHLGLAEGTPVVAGGADTQCGLLGAGAVRAGDLGVIAGTSTPLQIVTARPVFDPEGRLWNGQHVLPGLYVTESNGMATGEVLAWVAAMIYPDCARPMEALLADAARSTPGAEGVSSTLGAHIFDGRTIGIPVGNLTLSHMASPGSSRRELGRAVLEGLAFSVAANLKQIEAVTGQAVPTLKITGGLSRSPLWTEIVSDVTGRAVQVPATHESSSLGAAVCAAVGVGAFASFGAAAARMVSIAREQAPGGDAESYRKLYAGWKEAHGLRAAADSHMANLLTTAMMERPVSRAKPAPGFRPRIKVTASLDDMVLDRLRQYGEVDYANWRETAKVYSGEDVIGLLKGFHAFITEMDVVALDAVRELPDLRFIATCRGNPVNVDVEACRAFGIPVVYTPGRNADAVADLVIAFMLMMARRLPEASAFLKLPGGKAGDLNRMAEAYLNYQGRELWGKTVGLVGLGQVGAGVAARLRPFGARVLYYDPFVADGALFSAVRTGLEELLAESDFVSLHVPLSDATRGLLDAAALERMKPGACLVNTARAGLVDEAALSRVLESGRLAGAALDVFSVEPPAADNPLVASPRVIVTPHLGGNTVEVGTHQGIIAAEQLEQLLRGETPEFILNREVMTAFSWTGPRPEPGVEELARVAQGPGPTMTS